MQPIWGPEGQHYYPNPNWWSPDPGFGPGILVGRWGGLSRGSCTVGGSGGQIIATLTFIANDGSEIVFRDDLTNGQPTTLGVAACSSNIGSRGVNWHSVNGEGATFISDTVIRDSDMSGEFFPSGYLMTRDGTRARIDNGNVTWKRDRNGNRISFTYQGVNSGGNGGPGSSSRLLTATDSLNRQISISYGSPSPTVIAFAGFGGATRTIEIGYGNLGNALRYDQALKTYQQLWPDLPESGTSLFNPTETPTYVRLPDGRYYYFKYNSYRELARVELPTGGAVDYDWGGMIWLSWPNSNTTLKEIRRWVTEKRIYPNGGTGSSFTTRNTFSSSQGSSPTNSTLTTYDAAGNLIGQEIHSYFGGNFMPSSPAEYAPYNEGKESGNTVYNGATAVKSTGQTWENRAHVTWYTLGYATEPANDPRVTDVVTTLVDANLVSKVHTDYDDSYPYNNPKDVWEYDYGTGAPGALIRRTHTDYAYVVNGVNYATDPNIHLRGLPSQTQILDSSGNEQARTTYEYDNYANDGNRAALVDRAGIPGLDSSFTTSYTKRGNVTKVSRRLLPSTEIASYPRYDIAGNVVAAKDPRGNVAQIDYSSTYGYGLPTSQVTPVPDPSGTYGSSTALTTTMAYDLWTGKVNSVTDPNGQTTTYEYSDALDRLTRVVRPSGGGETVYQYGDTVGNLYLRTQTKRDATNWIDQYAYFDGLGRAKRTALSEGSSSLILADTEYDAMGRIRRATNPYRAASATGATPANAEWTTTTYDALSRAISVQTPDTAVVSTSYSGNVVTVTDQAGRQRRSLTDALGRLTRVDEPSGCNNCLGTVSSPLQPTSYSHDVLDNLRRVQQGSQNRYFMYDSLSRLIRARNVEQSVNSNLNLSDPVTGNSQWSIGYVYDANGNLLTKTDPLNIATSYVYDALNRNTGMTASSYSNGSSGVVIGYDNPDAARIGKGRFWYSHNYATLPSGELKYSYGYIDSYDAMGRPTSRTQKFLTRDCPGCSYYTRDFTMTRSYNPAGGVLTQTYPSGRAVNYGYDSAGRVSEFKGRLGGTPSDVYYARDIRYNARGQMTREEFGVDPGGHHAALYHRIYYNRRGQLFDIRLGTDGGSAWDVEDPTVWRWANGTWNRGALRLYYSASLNDYDAANPSQPDNNGNIHRMDHFVPNALDSAGNITSWVMGADAYGYDELNRLTQVMETPTGGSGPGFTQKYLYDRWGNRRIDTVPTSNVGGGVTDLEFQAQATTNRLLAPTDTGAPTDKMRYDAAGNLVWDEYSNAGNPSRDFGYDLENRVAVVKNSSGVDLARYLYDPEGQRVRRIVGGIETWMVHGFEGELVSEYSYNVGAANPQKEYGYRNGQMLVVWDVTETGNRQWQWLVSDHLGSPRMVVDRVGEATGIRRRDFLPFGEELASTLGHRNAANAGYASTPDMVRQKFTGKEKDNETSLDYFGSRFLASIQGRFVSADEQFIDQFEGEPQSWNLYSYVRNNPLKFIDPEGEYKTLPDGTVVGDYDGECIETGACWNNKRNMWIVPGEPDINAANGNVVGSLLPDEIQEANHRAFSYEMQEFTDNFDPTPGGVKGILGGMSKMVGRQYASKILTRNLLRSGLKQIAGTAAHHIVPVGAQRATLARRILAKFRIDINSVENGVFLPRNSSSSAQGVFHNGRHSNAYIDTINNLFKYVRTRDEALAVLHYVRSELLKGKGSAIPWP